MKLKLHNSFLLIALFISTLVYKSFATTCPIRVPGNCTITLDKVWGDSNVQFQVPFKIYAFAAAHASRWADEAADLGQSPRLPPAFFFTTALIESYLGCSNKLQQPDLTKPGVIFTRDTTYMDGCLQIVEGTAWVELKRMFPNDFAAGVGHNEMISSSNQDKLGRDNFVGSAFSMVYYHVDSHSLMYNVKKVNVIDFAAKATDIYAVEKCFAVNFNQGTWITDLDAIFANCTNKPIQDCTSTRPFYPQFVGSYMQTFDDAMKAGNFYNEDITLVDVQNYANNISFAFVSTATGTALVDAATKAFNCVANGNASVPFQNVAGAIMDAMDAVIKERPRMTDAILASNYQTGYTVPKTVQVNKYPCVASNTSACQNSSTTTNSTANNTTNTTANITVNNTTNATTNATTNVTTNITANTTASNQNMVNNTANNQSTVNTQLQNQSNPTSNDITSDTGSDTSWGLIIGLIAGGLLVAAAISALVYFGLKKYRANKHAKRRTQYASNDSSQQSGHSNSNENVSQSISESNSEHHHDDYSEQ